MQPFVEEYRAMEGAGRKVLYDQIVAENAQISAKSEVILCVDAYSKKL